MRTPLDKALRGKLEKTVEKARDIVEIAVAEALTRLGISDGSAPSYLSDEERKLRNRLRAHGRQLGDALNKESGKQETELLINEMSYEHWHRMLFARFLEQSDLLMYDQNTHVTLDECFELAEEEADVTDGWELAGQLAQKMLPQIFRADSPVFEVKLSINHVNTLEELIAKLHEDTFQASDALGWCYQFWQNKKKKQVNESGVKIGAKELSPVTQLFTEPYMVSFLLDNALGAWWAKRRLSKDDLLTATSEQELRELAAIPGVPLEYLRFIKDEESGLWSNAAGDFDKWPENLSELKTLDPCCGSGHFLVAKFLMLVPMRMKLEALTAKQAIDKVIAENIHGLELDQRCVELAAFALALEAWRYPGAGGYRQLPELQLACSGLSINEAQKEWKDLVKDDEELQGAVKWMQETFKNAPTLGSLIEPKISLVESEQKPWECIQEAVRNKAAISNETKAIAQGLAKSAELLTESFDFVATNPPYLGEKKQEDYLRRYIVSNFNAARADLATAFSLRISLLLKNTGHQSLVIPQNWLYQRSYLDLRTLFLKRNQIKIISQLGSDAFDQSVGADVLLISLSKENNDTKSFCGIDVTGISEFNAKIEATKNSEIKILRSSELLVDDCRIVLSDRNLHLDNVNQYSNCYAGILNGDTPRFVSSFWEVKSEHYPKWQFFQRTVSNTCHTGGRSNIILWENGDGQLRKLAIELREKLHDADRRGNQVWGTKGVVISQMGELPATLYSGELYDQSVGIIAPKKEEYLLPIWAYCSSSDYNHDIRKIDKNKKVTVATLIKTQFDFKHWSKVAKENYPNGLPQPYSDDLTQWIFHGHPCASVNWNEQTKTTSISELRQDETVLQVAVARLLGYCWPAELDAEMELAPEMREIIAENKVFDGLVDDDGIVCIPAIRGEKPAVDRLETILHAAYGDEWSATILNNLLKSVKSRDLNLWLRDKFFEQHSKLFQHRPFILQIWDGLPDGFSALVNYHSLDYKGLERLIYTYLDDWISTQIQQEKDGDEGAELRLTAARNLRERLEAILVGEEGLDIFVRWKSPAEQPIGWNPDLNDGVRLNIRPFMQAKDVGKKEAGILRSKPNIHWKKDRGTDVASAPWFDLGLEYGGKQGDRINDHHLTLNEKKTAREAAEIAKKVQSKEAESV